MSSKRADWLRGVRDESRPDGFFFTNARFFPDDLLYVPEDYRGQDAVSIVCTQVRPPDEQKRIVAEWAQALPEMRQVRRLYFESLFPLVLLEPLAQMYWLESLYIKWSKLKSIAPLARMQSLREFHLGSSPSLTDPEVALNWPEMRRLSYENVKQNYDVAWLADMPNLEQLILQGGMDTVQRIKSLEPVGKLESLQRLNLASTKVADSGSLFVLARLPNLTVLQTANTWPKGALIELASAKPEMWINGVRGSGFAERAT